MPAEHSPTIRELANQIARTRDIDEALRLSALLRETAHTRALEIRQATESLRVTEATTGAVAHPDESADA